MATTNPSRYKEKQRQKGVNNHLTFPTTQTAHSIMFVFKKYEYSSLYSGFTGIDALGFDANGRSKEVFGDPRNNRRTGADLAGVNSIQLPFPKQLNDSSSLRLNGFETSGLFAQAAQAMAPYFKQEGGTTIKNIPSLIQKLGSNAAQVVNATDDATAKKILQDVLGTSTESVVNAALYFMRTQLGGDMGAAINATRGGILNPKETLAFEGVNLKTHQFNWDLYPSNRQDSERIRQIVNRFKQNILPKTQTEVLFNQPINSAILQYPAVVDIYLLGVDETHYMKFKPSIVSDFGVDYGAGGGVSIMKGGKPAGVNLSLTLQELEIHTSEDYGDDVRDSEIEGVVNEGIIGLDNSGSFGGLA